MLQYIEECRTGSIQPSTLMSVGMVHRSYSLGLSKFKDFEIAHRGGINDLDLEKIDGRYLLSGGSDGSIVIHDIANFSGTPRYTCKVVSHIKRKSKYAHQYSVEAVQWYPFDTGMFSTSSMDKTLKIWDTNRMKPAEVIRIGCNIFSHQMSPIALKHNLIAVGTSREHIQLVDLKSGSFTHELRGHKGSVLTVAWSPSNEYLLASGSVDNKVMLWDVRSAKGKLKSLDQHNGDSGSASSQMVNTAHSGAVNGIHFNELGDLLVSYGTDDRIRVWNVKQGLNTMVNFGKVENRFKRGVKITTSNWSKNELIFVPSDSDLYSFEMHSGQLVNTFLGHFNSANCCIFNLMNQELYSGGNDRNILIWTPDLEQEKLFDEHISLISKKKGNHVGNIIPSLKAATADNWSSDED